MSNNSVPMWANRRIVHDSHKNHLERNAALKEFEHGHSRQEAEKLAYEDYKREHHLKAAAHHLRGVKAAQGSGDTEEAHKHGMALELHLKALGHEGQDIPAEVKALVDGEDKERHYKFKTHASDALLLDDNHKPE